MIERLGGADVVPLVHCPPGEKIQGIDIGRIEYGDAGRDLRRFAPLAVLVKNVHELCLKLEVVGAESRGLGQMRQRSHFGFGA